MMLSPSDRDGFSAPSPLLGETHLLPWLAPLRRRLLVSFLFALAVVFFLVLCFTPSNTMDDWGISFYLSGRSPGLDTSLFINYLLGKAIYTLNVALPDVNWFFVLEQLSSLLAFWALCFAALSYVPLGAGLSAVGFYTAFVLPLCTSSSNFTVVSGLCTSVGLLYLALQAFSEKAGLAARIVGALLFVLGMLWRQNMFLASLPFLAIVGIWWLGESLRSELPREELLVRLVPVLAAFLLCGAFSFAHSTAWQRPDLASWYEYNEVRSEIVDHLDLMPSYDEAAEAFASLGLSRNDYPFVITTMNADTAAVPLEIHEGILALQKPLAAGPSDFIRASFSYLRLLLGRWKFAAAILLPVVLALPRHRRRLVPMALALCGSVLLCSYFLLWARLIDRVEIPVWCYSIVACLALSTGCDSKEEADDARSASIAKLAVAVGMAACLAGLLVCVRSHIGSLDAGSYLETYRQGAFEPDGIYSDYLSSNDGSLYLFSAEPYDRLQREYGFRFLPDSSVTDRVACLVGWGVGSPYRAWQAGRYGQESVVATLLAQTDPSLLVSRRDVAEQVLVFLQEHYDEDASLAQVDVIDADGDNPVCVWSFSGSIPAEGPHPALSA